MDAAIHGLERSDAFALESRHQPLTKPGSPMAWDQGPVGLCKPKLDLWIFPPVLAILIQVGSILGRSLVRIAPGPVARRGFHVLTSPTA